MVALLLALLLPLQSFAAAAHCEHASSIGQSAAHEHCAHLATPAHSPQTYSPYKQIQQHHDCCTDCCLTAVVAWHLAHRSPAVVAAELSLPAPRALMTMALERLDRPPRHLV